MNAEDYFVDPDISKASTLPGSFYGDETLLRVLKGTAFARSWQFVGSSQVVKVPGQCYPHDLLPGFLDEPLLFTRDMDDVIHCVSNSCTHRGALVVEGPTLTKQLRCRYHGRRFHLDGKFLSMPEFEGCQNFPSDSDNLKSVPFAEWRGLLFVGIDPAVSISDFLSEVVTRVGFLPIEQFQFSPERAKDYVVRANWALYCENYLEGFHIPYIHPGLNAEIDYGNYTTICFEHGVLQIAYADESSSLFALPKDHIDHGKGVAAYYFWLYPNLMLNFYPWGLSVNVVQPIAPNMTKVSFLPFVWKQELISLGAGGALDRVEREDEAIVESAQIGATSRFYGRGRYSPSRETGTHHFHRMISASLLKKS